MANEIRYRSDAIRIKCTLKVNDVAVNLTDYSGIVFILYYKQNVVLEKYSRDVLAGYNNADFKVIDAPSGRFDILVQPSISLIAYGDELKGEIQVQKADADWENGVWRKIKDNITLFRIQDAKSKETPVS